jgi:tRNA A-37 threonylcarbamoyl transferase component Bud32
MPGVPDDLWVALAERYDLERELGHGAMAAVYLARDLRYNRPVAVKVLNDEMAAAVGRERFRREIEIVARLNHPHILPLLDSGDAQGFLYYVMPYAEGGSLRDRLDRETQLAIPDAIGIVRDVALALEHAHRLGFIHRDVKPENILFSGGYALIADFGIARVAEQVSESDRLTQSGISPGTPTYMSPEQAAGEGGVDERSDLYSLACVLYELLAGQPPFSGKSVQAVLARHRFDPVPPLRTVRRTVSAGLERVVLRALEKVPADRQKSTAEFAAELAAAPKVVDEPPWWQKPRVVASLVLGLAFGVALFFHWLPIPQAATVPADTTRYVILPFERAPGIASFNEEQLLGDAFGHWHGITVVDPFQVRDAIAQVGNVATTRTAQRVAGVLGAGRYVRGEVSNAGDSLRVYGGVYDAANGSLVHDGVIKVVADLESADSGFLVLADRLLFGGAEPAVLPEPAAGTSSRPARQAFVSGLEALEHWDLAGADSGFAAATKFDPDYAQAFLWLALVRVWNGAPAAAWESAAERAAARRTRFTDRDRLLSNALLKHARGDVPGACDVWKHLSEQEGGDFVAWYGLANCLSRDDVVVRSATSVSGWTFRSSYSLATKAYQRAYRLFPSIHRSLQVGGFKLVRNVLFTNHIQLRPGRALPPDTMVFAAYPTWQGDTLAFYPYPKDRIVLPSPSSTATNLAIRHERELFHDIAVAWATAFPQSADAAEAVALSLEMLNDPSSLDGISKARGLARTPAESVRVSVDEVWLRVRHSIPSDPLGLQVARVLADSLLHAYGPSSDVEPALLGSLAAVTGRAHLAADYCRRPSAASALGKPASLEEVACRLLIFAVFGGPKDSLTALEQTVSSLINSSPAIVSPEGARMELLARSATLAFPDHEFRSMSQLVGKGDYLLDAQAALLRGDTIAVRRLFSQLRSARASRYPADLTLDALLPEARLLIAIGDPPGAIAWLDPTLGSLVDAAPEMYTDPVRAGSLVRAIELRADLAIQENDPATAARWAKVALVLGSDADGFLQPELERLRGLAR